MEYSLFEDVTQPGILLPLHRALTELFFVTENRAQVRASLPPLRFQGQAGPRITASLNAGVSWTGGVRGTGRRGLESVGPSPCPGEPLGLP